MSPNFLKFVKEVLEKLQSHEANKKDPNIQGENNTLLPSNKLIKNSKKNPEEEAEKLSEAVRKISEQPEEQPTSQSTTKPK